jgi:hypothetical protein
MSNIKFIPVSDFEPVFERQWRPVVLQGQALPPRFRSLPDALGCEFIASGERLATTPYPSRRLRNARLVGGIDVYRDAPDDPVALNKDWYAVLAVDSHPDLLFVERRRDSEHWIDERPARYDGIEVIIL